MGGGFHGGGFGIHEGRSAFYGRHFGRGRGYGFYDACSYGYPYYNNANSCYLPTY
jgi:hypothetical protein